MRAKSDEKLVWVMGYGRVMGYSPQTNLGNGNLYGLLESMGYMGVWVISESIVYW